jgi:hypothetical protein
MFFSVQCNVICDTPEHVASVMEALGRVGTGLALEGRTVNVSIVTVEDDD